MVSAVQQLECVVRSKRRELNWKRTKSAWWLNGIVDEMETLTREIAIWEAGKKNGRTRTQRKVQRFHEFSLYLFFLFEGFPSKLNRFQFIYTYLFLPLISVIISVGPTLCLHFHSHIRPGNNTRRKEIDLFFSRENLLNQFRVSVMCF